MERKSIGCFICKLFKLWLLVFSTAAFSNTVDVQIVGSSINRCKDIIFYNNSNRRLAVSADYRYDGADGSYMQFTIGPTPVEAGQQIQRYLSPGSVDCDQGYNIKILHYRWQ